MRLISWTLQSGSEQGDPWSQDSAAEGEAAAIAMPEKSCSFRRPSGTSATWPP
jgi:hypothetical protein